MLPGLGVRFDRTERCSGRVLCINVLLHEFSVVHLLSFVDSTTPVGEGDGCRVLIDEPCSDPLLVKVPL